MINPTRAPLTVRPSGSVGVSVVIPCYNAASFVEEAIASALGQAYPVREVVCVDDGSTDDTLDVLRRVVANERRIRVLAGPNRGPSAARNRGADEASGEHLQFLDADDLLEPDELAHQAALVEREGEHPNLIAAA